MFLKQKRTDKRTKFVRKICSLAHLPQYRLFIAKREKQMAKEIRYTLTPSAPSRDKGVLCVVAAYKGTDRGRRTEPIKGLTSPDFRYWDKKTQRFTSGTDTAKENNPVLDAICERCNELLNNSAITSTDEFIDALRSGVTPSNVITLGDFLRTLIDEMRNGTNNKRPSKNYQCYINLLHKLEKEESAQYKGKKSALINVPIAEIDNKCFIQFSNFVLSLSDDEGRTNYSNIMKLFKQVHTKAYERELTDAVLRFNYSNCAPLLPDRYGEKSRSLTPEQYAQFVALDVKTLRKSGSLSYELMQMYKDFCIFLYEVQMRPVDVTRAHIDNIVTSGAEQFYHYTPEKKKNYRSTNKGKITDARLTDTALSIIEKYKGKSSQGYIFPFSLNEYNWEMMNANSWKTWNNRKARLQEMINKWLREKVAKALNWEFVPHLYTFRHSTLTHACMAEGANLMRIALNAGTSIEMLQRHYVSNTVTVTSTAK